MSDRVSARKVSPVIWLIFIAVVYVAVELVSMSGLWVLRTRRGGIEYFPSGSKLLPKTDSALDDWLAGRPSPTLKADSTLGWRRVDVTAQRLRDDRLRSTYPAPGTVRIAAFGDSFTFGSDVKLHEAWSKRVEALNPSIEVLNYGIGGFGLDQAYLRYQLEGTVLNPDVVFIGYMTENIGRNVNVFRGFYATGYSGFFFSKPRFRLDGDSLRLLPNPLRNVSDYRRLRNETEQVLTELGANDFHYSGHYRASVLDFSPTVRLLKLVAARARKRRVIPIHTPDGRYDTRSEAYQLTLRIFDAFHAEVLRNGAIPIIVVFPDVDDQRRSRARAERKYAPLLAYFRSRGYQYIDLLEAFEPAESRFPLESLVVNWGHFSARGNDLAARLLVARLAADSLTSANRLGLRRINRQNR